LCCTPIRSAATADGFLQILPRVQPHTEIVFQNIDSIDTRQDAIQETILSIRRAEKEMDVGVIRLELPDLPCEAVYFQSRGQALIPSLAYQAGVTTRATLSAGAQNQPPSCV